MRPGVLGRSGACVRQFGSRAFPEPEFFPKEVTLGFELFKESYAGSIQEITLGKGDKAVTVGGETCYPFCQFEGKMPSKPKIAMEDLGYGA